METIKDNVWKTQQGIGSYSSELSVDSAVDNMASEQSRKAG